MAVLGALAVLLAVSFSAQSAQAKTLRVVWAPNAASMSAVIAQQQGFFKKRGLDVTITANTAAGTLLPTLGKQYDIILSPNTAILLYASKGGDVKVVSGMGHVTRKTKPLGSALMVKKGINSVKQLKGATIGTVGVGAGAFWVSTQVALKKAGLNPKKDVKFLEVPLPNLLDALRAGRIDAAIQIGPLYNQMKPLGYAELMDPLLSVSPIAVTPTWVGKGSAIKKDPKSYKAFRAGIAEAIRWQKANQAAAVKIIADTLRVPESVARGTNFTLLDPTVKNEWYTDWVKPMQSIGLFNNRQTKRLVKYQFIMK